MDGVPDRKQTENVRQTPGQDRHMAEASPNPHNEAKISEVPVRTDQQASTASQNIAATPSTREGRIHPSVGESVGGGVADTDSMFNAADPQVAELGPSGIRTRARSKGEEQHPKDEAA